MPEEKERYRNHFLEVTKVRYDRISPFQVIKLANRFTDIIDAINKKGDFESGFGSVIDMIVKRDGVSEEGVYRWFRNIVREHPKLKEVIEVELPILPSKEKKPLPSISNFDKDIFYAFRERVFNYEAPPSLDNILGVVGRIKLMAFEIARQELGDVPEKVLFARRDEIIKEWVRKRKEQKKAETPLPEIEVKFIPMNNFEGIVRERLIILSNHGIPITKKQIDAIVKVLVNRGCDETEAHWIVLEIKKKLGL